MLVLPLCSGYSLSLSSSALVTPDDAPVLVELYYESFCPGCKHFITTMLAPTFDKLKDTGIMKIGLYPYGNAHENQLPDGSWNFTCQHGAEECKGNLLEVCVMEHSKWDFNMYLPIITCMESAESPVEAAEGCLAKHSPHIPYKVVKNCAKGSEGNTLMHNMANRTESLNPAHKYVPWIVVQGKHTEKLEQEAMSNLVALVCGLYQGAKPTQCDASDLLTSNIFIQRDWIDEDDSAVHENDDLAEEEEEDLVLVDENAEEDTTCVLCKYVMATLDGVLSDKANEEEIKEALESVCTLLPSSVTPQCDKLVGTYTQLIIDLLTKDVTPEMVCDNLGLCPGA